MTQATANTGNQLHRQPMTETIVTQAIGGIRKNAELDSNYSDYDYADERLIKD